MIILDAAATREMIHDGKKKKIIGALPCAVTGRYREVRCRRACVCATVFAAGSIVTIQRVERASLQALSHEPARA